MTTWCSRPVRNRSDAAKKQQSKRDRGDHRGRFLIHGTFAGVYEKNRRSHSPLSQLSMIPIEALRVRSRQETLNPWGDGEKARDSAFMREQVNIK